MPRYIDVEKADEIIEKELGVYDTTELKEMLSCFPTEDVRVVRHGRWIDTVVRGNSSICCSECGSENNTICLSNYCHNCGAKMDKKEDKDENNKNQN